MSEYIKKEEAVKELLHLAQNLFFCEQILGAIRAVELVCGIPMCDVVERKVGRWETVGVKPYVLASKCSVCGKSANMEYPFCPNCGADMREGGGT